MDSHPTLPRIPRVDVPTHLNSVLSPRADCKGMDSIPAVLGAQVTRADATQSPDIFMTQKLSGAATQIGPSSTDLQKVTCGLTAAMIPIVTQNFKSVGKLSKKCCILPAILCARCSRTSHAKGRNPTPQRGSCQHGFRTRGSVVYAGKMASNNCKVKGGSQYWVGDSVIPCAHGQILSPFTSIPVSSLVLS